MGEKLFKDPDSSLFRSYGARQVTQDAQSIEHVQEISGNATTVAALDPSSDEYKQLEKRLVRKIDIRLMPILVLLYVLNYLVSILSLRSARCHRRYQRSTVLMAKAGRS